MHTEEHEPSGSISHPTSKAVPRSRQRQLPCTVLTTSFSFATSTQNRHSTPLQLSRWQRFPAFQPFSLPPRRRIAILRHCSCQGGNDFPHFSHFPCHLDAESPFYATAAVKVATISRISAIFLATSTQNRHSTSLQLSRWQQSPAFILGSLRISCILLATKYGVPLLSAMNLRFFISSSVVRR